jgi:hypothetical protein
MSNSDSFAVRRPVTTIPLTHGTSVTTVTSGSIALNGELQMFKVKSGPVDASATLTLNIIDQDGDTVYTKASIASNTTVITDLEDTTGQIPLSGNYTLQIVTSAAQTATNNTFTITLYIDAG